MFRSLFVAVTAVAFVSSPALASTVYVQFVSPSLPNTVLTDPLLATATEPGIFIEADLVNGSFQGHAVHGGESAIASVAYSGILELTISNAGAGAVTFGGSAHPFYADVTGTPSGALGDSGSVASQLSAIFQVNDPGGTRIASIGYSALHAYSGGALQSETFDATPSESSGAVVSISTATANALAVRLSMPDITLESGQSAVIYFNLLPVSIAGGGGFAATTDATAQLHLFLPDGATVTSNADTPLAWISVPEPSLAALVALALAGYGLAGILGSSFTGLIGANNKSVRAIQ
jgi:hypothetical protein